LSASSDPDFLATAGVISGRISSARRLSRGADRGAQYSGGVPVTPSARWCCNSVQRKPAGELVRRPARRRYRPQSCSGGLPAQSIQGPEAHDQGRGEAGRQSKPAAPAPTMASSSASGHGTLHMGVVEGASPAEPIATHKRGVGACWIFSLRSGGRIQHGGAGGTGRREAAGSLGSRSRICRALLLCPEYRITPAGRVPTGAPLKVTGAASRDPPVKLAIRTAVAAGCGESERASVPPYASHPPGPESKIPVGLSQGSGPKQGVVAAAPVPGGSPEPVGPDEEAGPGRDGPRSRNGRSGHCYGSPRHGPPRIIGEAESTAAGRWLARRRVIGLSGVGCPAGRFGPAFVSPGCSDAGGIVFPAAGQRAPPVRAVSG